MRVVIKIGTSTLAHPTGHLNIRRTEKLCKIISDIKNAGHQVILVSSGAIGMGVGKPKAAPTDAAIRRNPAESCEAGWSPPRTGSAGQGPGQGRHPFHKGKGKG